MKGIYTFRFMPEKFLPGMKHLSLLKFETFNDLQNLVRVRVGIGLSVGLISSRPLTKQVVFNFLSLVSLSSILREREHFL